MSAPDVRESWPIDGHTVTEVDVNGITRDVETIFCNLGDILCSSGACDSAIAARCYVAWGKFCKLLPVLPTRHLSPSICGKVYEAYVQSAMLHGSETWGPNSPELQGFHRSDPAMIRWICVKTETKYPQLHYYRNLALTTSSRSFTVDHSDGMAMWNRPRLISNLSQTFRFPAPKGQEGLGRHGLNVWRLMSMGVA